ncbi:hypothetical protein ACWCP6_24150 [Streptomyces sp. NPDC002004]
MDLPEFLEAHSLLVPERIATANEITVSDVWDHLAVDEWDVALGVLEERRGDRPLPPGFWDTLATAAGQLGLERSAAWCRWRACEARNGIIRADLTLRPVGEARRRTPVPGAGVLRPMWNIGHPAPNGEPRLAIARLWVEYVPVLPPGGRATVRLDPLDRSGWQHLRPGQVITMHEDRTVAGSAVVLEVRGPATTGPG